MDRGDNHPTPKDDDGGVIIPPTTTIPKIVIPSSGGGGEGGEVRRRIIKGDEDKGQSPPQGDQVSGGDEGDSEGPNARFGAESADSDDDKCPEEQYLEKLSKQIPQGTDRTPGILSRVLDGLSDRWKNWVIRGIFTWLMISLFCVIIYYGPLALMVTTLVVQVNCFAEIINIGYSVYKVHNLPWFRSLSWYFLITSNYFFYGESMVDYFGVFVRKTEPLRWLITRERIYI